MPLRLNAWPTLPIPNVTPLTSVPSLPPWMSFALLLAGHQLTMSAGGGVHCGLHLPSLPAW